MLSIEKLNVSVGDKQILEDFNLNIGKGEVRRRQVVALAGAVISATSLVGLLNTDAARSARYSLFIPLMVFAIGFVQSRKKC